MENEKGVPEVDFPLLAHLLFYVPWDIKIFSEKKNLRAQILYFILREMTHDETATEAQYQNDDGEYHGCGIRPVLYILLRRTQLKEYA